ncbi:MAG: Ribosome-associated protein L7Ae-like protein [Firmicutes bacterium ADurb.Bin193]|nr:MAG: Ribosome-associated protein L7Ae-like protein [Firmicutes bacterium ADurb.Bin193]
MNSNTDSHPRYVGFKQSKRAIEEGKAAKALIAQDCADGMRQTLVDLCKKHGVEIEYFPTMKQLGEKCGIDVGSAVAVVVKL